MLCGDQWCEGREEGRPHTVSLLLLFSPSPRSVGSSQGNNKSIFVFDEDVSSDKSTIFVVFIHYFPPNEDMILAVVVVV